MNLNEYKLKQCIVSEKRAKEYLENDIEGLIVSFLKYLNDEKIDIYNEDSLKFELGTFLRIILPNYNICFEKNIKCFIQDKKTIKHEIDITIYPKKNKNNQNDNNIELIDPETTYAIELKFPSFKIEKENNKFINKYNNGTNKILKELETDLDFIKELVDNGFKNAWSFVLVPEISNPIYKFPENPKKAPSKIYYRFREFDDNGIRDNIHGITWLEWENKGKYYIKSGHKK